MRLEPFAVAHDQVTRCAGQFEDRGQAPQLHRRDDRSLIRSGDECSGVLLILDQRAAVSRAR